jgi:class 3 adenylate cyclase
LPPDLLDQLPAPHALTLAIRRLNSLHQAVSSFLPQYIAENESLLSEDHGDLRPGTFMFADVSGFTALSEKLQKEDRRDGADVMTEIINQYFGTMLEILAKSNGQLLKFAGDALLTFFPAKPNEVKHLAEAADAAMAEQFSRSNILLTSGSATALG